MYNHLLYLLYWLVNAAVILALGWMFPNFVQLGVNKFIPLEAAIYSGFWLTFFVWSMWDFVLLRGVKIEGAPAFVYFLMANFIGFWLLSYASRYTGLVVDGWWLVVLALLANFGQRLAWKWVIKRS